MQDRNSGNINTEGIQVGIKHRVPLTKALQSIFKYIQLNSAFVAFPNATHSPNFVNKSIFTLPCKCPTQHRITLPTADQGGKVPKTFAIWSPSKRTGTPRTLALDAAVRSWVVWDGNTSYNNRKGQERFGKRTALHLPPPPLHTPSFV